MSRPVSLRIRAAAIAVGIAAMLAGCAGTPDTADQSTTAGSESTPSGSPTPTAIEIAPFPMGQSSSTTALPDDCRAMLSDAILATLENVPLNAPGMGGGIRPDSSRVCVWADPGASTTHLVTVIGYSPEREARDAMYALGVEDGFTCYEPDAGIRCEKTWENEKLPVTDGRTVYWRDGVVIDTQYSNLAPAGFTAAIVRYLWPAA